MKIESKKFGVIEFNDDRIINFDEGLLGMSTLKRFIIADDSVDPDMPFKWLISLDDLETSFLVTDPGLFFKDYIFTLNEDERKKLQIESEDDVCVMTLLTVPEDPSQITANLRGPLVVNTKSMKGRQVVLKGTEYTTKHFVFIQRPESAVVAPTERSEKSVTMPDVSAAVVRTAQTSVVGSKRLNS